MLGEMMKSVSIMDPFSSRMGILQCPITSMEEPLAAKSLHSLGNTCSRLTKCTGNKFTSQPESYKHRVTLPLIVAHIYTNLSLVGSGSSVDDMTLALAVGGCKESCLSFSASSAILL